MVNDAQFARLRWYNAFMGFLHLTQAAVILTISNDFTLAITTSFAEYLPQTGKSEPVTDTLINLPLGPVIALFLLLSAITRLVRIRLQRLADDSANRHAVRPV